ncbi:TPA: ASCH domain-containing protein [Providencia rettgeri]|uniref:ASCH domain-containing protein n=1 Tax=Providencia TaxID=586 RepID=UPI001B9F47E0|nr:MULTISPECIES: ASCH domain-containing protein [Providencia]EMB5784944.1 ASCH domain-containing protein [Providencia rettgeri]HBC7429613.1 ASCH domain-containing protein [Providencia rettgeri]
MKAISIVRPSGQKIALGEKTLEIRKWPPNIDAEEELLIVENSRYLLSDDDEEMGKAVAIVKVNKVRPFIESDMAAACASYYELGWLAWELTDIRAIAEPIEVIAKRKIYEVELGLEPKKKQHD